MYTDPFFEPFSSFRVFLAHNVTLLNYVLSSANKFMFGVKNRFISGVNTHIRTHYFQLFWSRQRQFLFGKILLKFAKNYLFAFFLLQIKSRKKLHINKWRRKKRSLNVNDIVIVHQLIFDVTLTDMPSVGWHILHRCITLRTAVVIHCVSINHTTYVWIIFIIMYHWSLNQRWAGACWNAPVFYSVNL